MRRDRKPWKARVPMQDYNRNLSARMTEEQHRRLQRYMGMTRLCSMAYFCRLIQGGEFKGRSPRLSHALHTSVSRIYSNVKQITRHQRTGGMDTEAVSKLLFLTDKLYEEVYLPSSQKQPSVGPQETPCGPPPSALESLPCLDHQAQRRRAWRKSGSVNSQNPNSYGKRQCA